MRTEYIISGVLALSAMAFLLGSAGIFLIIAGSALAFYALVSWKQIKLNQRAYEAEIRNREVDSEFRSVVLSKIGILAYNRGELSFWSKRETLPDRRDTLLEDASPEPEIMPDVMPLISDAIVLLIQGEQGAGKTTLLTNIIQDRRTRGEVLVIDSHGYEGKYGEGIQVVGVGRRYDDIDRTFLELLNLMTERYEDYHRVNHPMLYICIDEYTLLYKKCPSAKDFIESALTEFRKVNFRLVACVHSLRAKFLNLEGGMDLADGLFKLCLKCENGRRWGDLSKYQKSECIAVALPGPFTEEGNVTSQSHGQEYDEKTHSGGFAVYRDFMPGLPTGTGETFTGIEPETVSRVYESQMEKKICEMWRDRQSLNEIARAVWGSSNGRRTAHIRNVLENSGYFF